MANKFLRMQNISVMFTMMNVFMLRPTAKKQKINRNQHRQQRENNNVGCFIFVL